MSKITKNTIITGAEFRAFYCDNWPGDDWYLDDNLYEVEDENGNYNLPDDAELKLGDMGDLYWQGSFDKSPAPIPFWKAYKKFAESKLNVVDFNIKIPADKVTEFLALLKKMDIEV